MGLENEYFEILNGKYFFSKVDLLELAKTYGTPLYVISKEKIEKNIDEFTIALKNNFKEAHIAYASKAFSTKEIYRIILENGLYADTVSMGEILTAKSVDFPFEKLFFHGNAKTDEDLEFAIVNGVNIVVDNESEFNSIIRIAEKTNKIAKILFRIKPKVEAQTHSYIITGHKFSKFGLDLLRAYNLVEVALKTKRINFLGFHYHIGSQIFDINAFKASSEVVSSFLRTFKEKFGFLPSYLSAGGGFAVRYTENDPVVDKNAYISSIRDGLQRYLTKSEIDSMVIFIEPGRAIVGDAGIILYRVVRKKDVEGNKYLFVDGGMGDNIRPPLYEAKYTVTNVSKLTGEREIYSVFGKYCESGDIVATSVELPNTVEGDILAVLTAGAYTYSMASNYNRFPRPGVVMVERGSHKPIVRRESYEDVLKFDL